MMTRLRFFARATFAVACLVVAYLSLAPGGTIPQSNQIDKLLHVMGYAGLVWLGGLACRAWLSRLALATTLLAYGGVLEILQNDLPQHQASLLDMAANVGGLLTGLVALWVTDQALRRLTGRGQGAAAAQVDVVRR